MRRTLVVATLAAAALPALSADVTVMRAAREPVDGLILKVKPAAAEGALQTATQAGRRLERLAGLARAAGYPGSVAWRHLSDRMVSVKLPSSLTPEQQKALMAKIMATGQVEWVEANDRVWPHALPNDPAANPSNVEGQWWASASVSAGNGGVPNIRSAWDLSTGLTSGAAPIAILDTGRLGHEDLWSPSTETSHALPGYDFVKETAFSGDTDGPDSDPSDPGDFVTNSEAASETFRFLQGGGCPAQNSSWHGLAIEGIVSAKANNNKGLAGIHWSPRVMSVRVAGKCGANMDDIVAAMYWAAGVAVPSAVRSGDATASVVPAKVINISFGGSASCDNAYQTAINELSNRRTVVVASAGNEHGAVSRPANCQNVVAVAALNRLGLKSTYSNFGPQITVATVGGDPAATDLYTDAGAWSSILGDKGLYTVGNLGKERPEADAYFRYAGTSFSAPIVTGVIALMFDVNPGLTVDQVITGLKLSARPHVTTSLVGVCSSSNPGRCRCTTTTCGAGILDAREALVYAGNPTNYTNPNRNLPINLDNDPVVLGLLEQARTIATQDRGANVSPVSVTQASGGGGGSFSGLWVAALGLMAAWRNRPRRAVPGGALQA